MLLNLTVFADPLETGYVQSKYVGLINIMDELYFRSVVINYGVYGSSVVLKDVDFFTVKQQLLECIGERKILISCRVDGWRDIWITVIDDKNNLCETDPAVISLFNGPYVKFDTVFNLHMSTESRVDRLLLNALSNVESSYYSTPSTWIVIITSRAHIYEE